MSEQDNNTPVTAPESAAPAAQQSDNNDSRGRGRGGRGGRGRGGQGGRGKGRRRDRNAAPEKEFAEELLGIDRVTRVVAGGRRLRFRATVVIGDRKGRVGLGVDKAVEVPQAIQKAVRNAKKNLIKVPIVNGTIPHNVEHKFKAAKIMIMPAKSGSGITIGGSMRKIADLAGIEDISGKSYGTTNKITTGKAMMQALQKLATETETTKPADHKDKSQDKPAADKTAQDKAPEAESPADQA